jgi:hypothetical protein
MKCPFARRLSPSGHLSLELGAGSHRGMSKTVARIFRRFDLQTDDSLESE